jgi:hypothetical protein
MIAEGCTLVSRLRLANGRGAFAVALMVIAIAFLACSTSENDGGQSSSVLTPDVPRYLPEIVSSDLAVGDNRFVVGLIDQETNSPVLDAQLHFRFFKLDGDEGILKAEVDAKTLQLTKTYTHTHEDGTEEAHDAGEVGAYAANVQFDSPGSWIIEIIGGVDGVPIEPVSSVVEVRETSLSIALGQPAPRSIQPILSDVDDIAEVDTSVPPVPEMHDKTIADAVTSGQATVVVFATPAFCLSQICGPTKSIVDELYESHGDQANFVHVEPYDLEKARGGEALEVLPFVEQEWGLLTEPWVFLVDSEGNVAAKFEAVVSLEEIEEALRQIL